MKTICGLVVAAVLLASCLAWACWNQYGPYDEVVTVTTRCYAGPPENPDR